MTTKNCYPYTYTQSTSSKMVEYKNLANLKNINSSYAQSSDVMKGKKASPNRPSILTLKNFKCNIPTGSKVTSVTVYYSQQKIPKNQGKYPNIGAPTIGLTGVNVKAKKGKAPTKNKKEQKVTFKFNPSLSSINSANFGVIINYPSNSNNNDGYMRLYYVYIKVNYAPSNFTLKISKVSGGYNKYNYTIKCAISNAKATGYNPNVTITAPPGFTYIPGKTKGNGTVTDLGNGTFRWKPKMNAKTKSNSVNLSFSTNVTYPSGQSYYDGVFRATESLASHTTSHTAHITTAPAVSDTTGDYGSEKNIGDQDAEPHNDGVLFVKENEEFTLDLIIGETSQEADLYGYVITDNGYGGSYTDVEWYAALTESIEIKNSNNEWEPITKQDSPTSWIPWLVEGVAKGTFRVTQKGEYSILCYPRTEGDETLLKQVNICVLPATLTPPYFTTIELTQEEKDRLGNGENYILQTYLKLSGSETYIRNWNKNFRVCVFNNPFEENVIRYKPDDDDNTEPTIIDSTDYDGLTPIEMLEHAEYIGHQPTSIGEWQNCTCEFTYNKNYPLMIFLVGDYPESNITSTHLHFTCPCIIEADKYTQYEPYYGTYPYPINNTIANDDSIAETIIPANQPASTVIFNDWPLEEDYGSSDDMSIRGLGLEMNIEKTSHLVLSATMKAPTGEKNTRTIVLDEQDTTIDSDNNLEIGGVGDLWNFNTEDITKLEDWEIELTVNNNLTDTESSINYGNCRFIIYTEDIDHQTIQTTIDGEDLSYYGAFVESIDIPAGLKTETNYLNVKGSDVNDPYVQSIREKTITLELSVDSCDIQTSTDMLRQVTQLFVNERDEYNRPIPKRIEFSNYPDLYWEYILEDVIDTNLEISDYDLKIKLVIPSGTAYKKESTKTNNIGFIQGITAVKPIITIKPGTESNIEITETVSQQTFTMGFSGEWNEHIVEIDCENRIVWLKEDEDDTDPINISRYVDFNSDWFRLFGEYTFETTNCTLYSVDYTERW